MSVSDATLADAHANGAPDQSIDSLAHADGDLRVDPNMKSPYVDTEIVSLDAGPTKTRYRVHRAILAQSSELDAKSTQDVWGEKTIALPELDEMTVHTLVHYLYTGRYHALESRDLEGRSAISQYKLSTCAYCAAIRYKLPGLAELAKQTMVSLQDLTILDVLVVAREHAFPLLPEDETWFSEHLESAIHAAVTKDAGLFTTAGFVDQIEGDRRYRQVVMKAIVNTLSRGSAAASSANSEKDHRTSTLSPVVAIANYSGDITAMTTPETLLDEITPTLDTHVAPEPYTDELGWGSSTTYRNQKMSNQGVATVPSKPGHARVDSVIEDEAPAPVSVATSEATVPAPIATSEASVPAPIVTTEATVPAPAATTKSTVPAPAATTKATVPTPTVTTDATVPAPAAKTEPANDTAASPIVNGTDTNSAAAKKSKKKKKKIAAAAAAAAAATTNGVVNPVAANPAPVVAN